jgi:hypothetical protein
MTIKLSAAKSPLRKLHSDEAAAAYFQTHSVAEVLNQLPEGKAAKPSKALANAIRQRHTPAKSPISIRLGPGQIAAAKKIAAAKSLGYQTQLRIWIAEGIRRGEAGVIRWRAGDTVTNHPTDRCSSSWNILE